MNDPAGLRARQGQDAPAPEAPKAEQPPASYAGRTRYTQLEYEAVLANASIGIAFTRDRKFFLCNPKFAEMFGWGPDELIGQPGEAVYPSRESYDALGRIAVPILGSGRQLDLEWEVRRKDGSTFLCRMVAKAIDPANTQQGTVWIVEDITEQRRAEEELQRVLAEQQALLNNVVVGIAIVVRERKVMRCNRRFEELFDFAPGDAMGASARVLYFTEEEFAEGARSYRELDQGRTHSREQWMRRQDGSGFWCRLSGRAIEPGKPERGYVWLFENVTAERAVREGLERVVAERTAELQEARAHAQHLADHDALTGLPNRRLLEDRLTQALALSVRNRKQSAVMFVDLDRFKVINDTLGHAVGDELLKEAAQRLVKQLRIGDTVCRIGGDEFVVVLPEVKHASDAANVAQKVLEQLAQPMLIEGHELTVTSSIGISVYPDDGRDAETLIRNADAAMYHAKEMGRANYQFFTEQMNLAASRRLALEGDLRHAAARGELRLHFQPVLDLASGRVAAHEALVRWQHPARGLVPPAEFMPLAEDTGLILDLGEWVLLEACRWAARIGAKRGLRIAVNLSARQLLDPKLPGRVARALKETGLPARLLELEIAEATAMQQSDAALNAIKRLKRLGVAIAIDDFGTGFSSLATLKRFRVDRLKIDRGFIAELPRDRDQAAIAAAIVALAHALGMQVVAEGVENEAQKAFLASCRCDLIQGYLVGRPLEADAAAKEYV